MDTAFLGPHPLCAAQSTLGRKGHLIPVAIDAVVRHNPHDTPRNPRANADHVGHLGTEHLVVHDRNKVDEDADGMQLVRALATRMKPLRC